MNENFNITVAIPAYNAAKRLPSFLENLQKQTGIEHLRWEIIIIDNNSSDDTAEVVKSYQSSWQHPSPLRYFFEKRQGASWARFLAVEKAKGELIAFFDDDNFPTSNWLLEAYNFGQEHPEAGAWSGQIHGDLEAQPPENFERIKNFLAIREHGDKPYIFDAKNLILPPTAGLIVRKKAWEENVPSTPTLTGKLPGLFIQGDDYEALLHLYRAKWEIWYNPKMHIYHQIPAWRLEKEYLLVLASGCGLPTFQLRTINSQPWQIPFLFIKIFLSNLRRVVSHFIKYRGRLNKEFIALFEMKFYVASMMSPFCSINLNIRRIRNKFIAA